ncbi:3-oxoacyl-ACP synthase III family protein [Streptomyces sirii]|uniref:3-oxoacyl-ACP synthase III family protein n=1 Tax=Streptomyces sirii TaxID=3127701 RepID=UPI003D35A23E
MLLHVQTGHDHLSPPNGIVISGSMGLGNVRVLSIDASCAETMGALDLAFSLLETGRCERVILSGAADLRDGIDPRDESTVGLFGSGAAAVILSAQVPGEGNSRLRALRWETHSNYWKLGQAPLIRTIQHDTGVSAEYGYYRMAGPELMEAGADILPGLLSTVLNEADWKPDEPDLIVTHQPSVRILEMMLRSCEIDPAVAPIHTRKLGNMGPATLLSGISLARSSGRMKPGTKLLLFSFGLGFVCGAAAIDIA